METVWSSKIDEVLKIGYNLKELGIDNWALNKYDALEALDKLSELGVSILGGDVYENIEGAIQPNYDNWYCDKLSEESGEEFVTRSVKEARNYIERYKIKDVDKTYFVFVPGV